MRRTQDQFTRRGNGVASASRRREADRFLADLFGTALAAPVQPSGRGRAGAAEPFFGDGALDTWRVVARPGTPAAAIDLRDSDLVVRREPGGAWRCVPAGNLSARTLLDRSGRLRDGVCVVRRSSAAPAALDFDEHAAEQEASPCPAPAGSACAYFFRGANYLRYNIATDAVDVGPIATSRFWRFPLAFQTDLDAAVNWGDGHAYFFKGTDYVRYNIATDLTDVGPARISTNWPALPAAFQSSLDAAVNWGNGVAYFFKGTDHVRYNIAANTVDPPARISTSWTALPAEFQSGLDSVVNWGNGFAYFFKGARYLKYRISDNTIAFGPAPIAGNWPALPATMQSSLKAAINWTYPGDLAGLMRAAGLTVSETPGWRTRASTGEGGCFTPIGVMIHHTVSLGTAALNDIITNVKANFFIDRAGVVSVVSGGRANHAGRGAQRVLNDTAAGIAPTGTAAARGLPDAIFGNGHYYGFENENAGDGIMPWPAVQVDAMVRASAALCQRHCWSENRIISHAEWTSRKIDPRGIDMTTFRARVRSLF